MRFIYSVMASAAVVIAVLILALNQPSNALMITAKPLLEENATPNRKLVAAKSEITPSAAGLVGVSQKISLAQLPMLWQAFNDKASLHQLLRKKPSRIYVYYRQFSALYDEATVTIGYDVKELLQPEIQTTLPEMSLQQVVLSDPYQEVQLGNAWQTIDYRQGVQAVVEVHELGADSEIKRSAMFVAYPGKK